MAWLMECEAASEPIHDTSGKRASSNDLAERARHEGTRPVEARDVHNFFRKRASLARGLGELILLHVGHHQSQHGRPSLGEQPLRPEPVLHGGVPALAHHDHEIDDR